MVNTLPKYEEVLSASSLNQFLISKDGTNLTVDNPQWKDMPHGGLISICGDIENIQIYNHEHTYYATSKLNINQRVGCEFVVHLRDGRRKVQIHGNMGKAAYPLGLGRGANATFHRVLLACPSHGCCGLVLTPVSFIVINSVKETGLQQCDKRVTHQSGYNILVEDSSSKTTSSLFSQLTRCMEGKLFHIRCRVVTIYSLVLELPTRIPSESRSKMLCNYPVVNITLACFMLDDGSSLSCCWASGSRAERLLRLHEAAHRPFFYNRKTTKTVGLKSSRDTVGYNLEVMLKKHHRVVMKNNRLAPEASTLGFTFSSDSGEVLSCSDEKLLRLVIRNACTGPDFNVVGTVMSSNALQSLNNELKEFHVPILKVPNIWITNVDSLNPLNEARNMLHELTS